MEINIADRPLWKVIAVFWFIFAGVQIWSATNTFNSSAYLFSVIVSILLGIAFLTIKNITYLTLNNDLLIIHRPGLLGKKKIKYSDIKKSGVLVKEVILYLENGRNCKLKKDWISYDDLSKLKSELESYSIYFK